MDKNTIDTPLPDQEQLAEALSAWMDGEALPETVTEQQLWQWLHTDVQAQQLWHGWHAAGLCLREPGTAMAVPVGAASNWMEELQHRLANAVPEQAVGPLVVGAASLQEQNAAGATSQLARPVVTPTNPVPAPQPAANDAMWRWRAAGGVASVLLVVAATWGWMGQRQPQVPATTVAVAPQADAQLQPQVAPPGQQVQPPQPAQQQQPSPVLVATQETKPAVTAAAEKSKPAAPLAVTVAKSKPVSPDRIAVQPGVDADDGLQALMTAHAQLGEQWLLQDAVPPEKDEVF